MKQGSYHVTNGRALYSPVGHLGPDVDAHRVRPIMHFSHAREHGGPNVTRDLAISLIAHIGNFDAEGLQEHLDRRDRMGLPPIPQEILDLSGPLAGRIASELERGVTVFRLQDLVVWLREARGILQAERSGASA